MTLSLQKFILIISIGVCFILIGVMVSAGKVSAAPSLGYFKVTPASLSGPGWTNISWSVTGALACEMWTTDSAWLSTGVGHPVPGLGSGAIPVNVTTTYYLQCTDSNWATRSTWTATVNVIPPTPVNGSCSATHYNCSAGNLGITAEYSNQWQWWCNGTNGGANFLCSEQKPQCSNATDDDGDGKTDYPADPGCSSSSDNDEYNAPIAPPVNGSCSVTHYNCSSGSLGATAEYSNQWQWWCNGTNGGATPPVCVEMKPQCSNATDDDGDGKTDYPADSGCSSSSDTDEYNAPPVALVAPTITNLFGYNNNVYFSWDPVPGAAYYAIRIDNRADDPADSWQFNTGQPSIDCSNDITTDRSVLESSLSATKGKDYCGNISKDGALEFFAPYIVAGSKNTIWIHARSADGTYGPGTYVSYNGSPQQPTGLSATCDSSGNATISWNSVASADHYGLRVDDRISPWLYDINAYRTNHDLCVFDGSTDSNTLLEQTQGGGTDYCGNMKSTTWNKTLIPGHTYKAWVHSKTDLNFGNLPLFSLTQVDFTCSAVPIPTCTNGANNPPSCNTCSSGYVMSGGICVATTYSCSVPPANATLYGNINQTGLTSNTTSVYSESDTAIKCEYSCNSGYIPSGSTCVSAGATAPTLNFTATPNPTLADKKTLLSWTTSGTSCTGSASPQDVGNIWNGNIAPGGISQQVTLSGDTNFSLTCTNGGTPTTRNILVTVGTPISPDCASKVESNCILPTSVHGTVAGTCSVIGGTCAYQCDNGSWVNTSPVTPNTCSAPTAQPSLSAEPRLVQLGKLGTLKWKTGGTNEATCTLTGGALPFPNTILTNDNSSYDGGTEDTSGQYTLPQIYAKTTYTLMCGGLSDTATFEVNPINIET